MNPLKSESNIQSAPAEQAAKSRWRLVAKIALGAVAVAVAAWLGRDFAHHLPAIEDWIAAQGPWGYVAFIGAVVVFTSIFVPDTLFALIAGALFGLIWGTVLVVAGSLLTAAV